MQASYQWLVSVCLDMLIVLPARQVYYYNKQAQRTEVRGCWCHSCWNEAKEGLVQLDGSTVPKKDLDKRKNDEEVRFTLTFLRCERRQQAAVSACAAFVPLTGANIAQQSMSA